MKNSHKHNNSEEHFQCHGDHDHAHPFEMPNDRIKIYTKAWALTWAVAIVELIGSSLSGSMALLADVTHVLTDTIIGLAPVSVEIAKKRKSIFSPQNIERMGGVFASIILIFVGFSVLHEAGETHDEHINGVYMFIFALIAAGANFLQHKILSSISPMHRHSAHAGFHFHILTDFAKNLALPLVAIAIALGAPDYIDTYTAKAIGILIILRSLLLASESIYGHNFVQEFLKKLLNKMFQ